MKVLPDTFAFIEFFNGTEKGKVIRKYLQKDEVLLSSICIYEILYIIGKNYSKKKANEYYRSLKTHYEIVPVDENIATTAVDIKRKYNMPLADCLIYASAKENQAKVISGCKHFKKLKKERDVIIV